MVCAKKSFLEVLYMEFSSIRWLSPLPLSGEGIVFVLFFLKTFPLATWLALCLSVADTCVGPNSLMYT